MIFLALCVAILFSCGCDHVSVPLGGLEIRSIAISDSGEVAVVAGHANKLGHIWLREDWSMSGRWKPIAHSQKHEDLRVGWFGDELLVLRETGGKRDLYRLRDGVRLTEFADVADAAATPTELIIARPWGDGGQHVLFRVRDGRARHLLTSWGFIPGTLAVHDFGKGQELYWVEPESKGSVIWRCDLDAEEVKAAYFHSRPIIGPIVVGEDKQERGLFFREMTKTGLRTFSVSTEGLKSYPPADDPQGESYDSGATSYNGQWGIGWDQRSGEFIRTCEEAAH